MDRLALNRFWGFGILFAACAIASVLLYQPLVLALPFGLLAGLWVAHKPFVLFYALIAAIPWSIEYNFTSSLGTDLPTEPLMLLVSFSTLCYLAYHARSRPMAGFFRSPLTVLLLLQAFWWLVTAYFSTDFTRSIKFCIAKTWYLGAFIMAPFLLFRNPKTLVRTAQVLSVSMLLLVGRTMIRHAGYRFTFERINDSLWPNFRNHVNYSSVLVCVIPILVAAYVLAKPGWWKKALIGILLLAGVALVLSYARGAWLALIAGGVLFWMLRRKMLLRGYLLVLLAAGLSLFLLIDNDRYMKFAHDHDTTTFHTDFSDHLQATYQFKDVSTAERFYRWIAGVRMIRHNWATGWGPQTFSQNYQRYTIPAFRTWVSDNKDQSTVHNYYLTTIIEQGAAGLFILLVFIGYGLHAGQRIYHESKDRLWRAAGAVAAVVLGMQCTFNALNDLVETDKLGSLFYLAIAVLIAGEVHLRRQGEQEVTTVAP
ncbi:O-antigen ligase family protein [Flaviaesturariibacter amylovorans]|uniref:O-antigen ligase-related domain-containing protein n=1 Tax=Flaviaesturariibacter amylovorans TaxID=1084520 RepID=A0ABP8HPV6_9BACT